MESIVKRNIRDLDYVLIAVMILISVISCIAVYTSTLGKANPNTGSASLGIPAHILYRQIAFEVLSYIVMFVVMLFDYRNLAKLRWYFYGGTLLLLVAVFGFHRVNGAHSWIPFPLLSFQPSELAKLVSIIWVADYMSRMNEREVPDYSFRGLLPIFLAFIVPFVLILKEPALGQALVLLAIMYSMLLVYVKKKQMRWMLAASAIFISLIVVAVAVVPNQTVNFLDHQHILKPYQTGRLISFIEPGYDPASSGWQVHQAEIAVGAGGVFGQGIGKGSQTNGSWVPFQWTDFIFSAIAEQLGFVGSSVLIMLFLIMLYRLIRVATTALDDFASYVIAGIVGMFAFQVFENIGMNLVVTPATGITLPFVSYGGSSLVVNFISIGIALSVSVRRRTLRFD
ncbi:FtsW/RodA/SpoVE family cell cycle protein [Ferroacidibacillus organovorans]|uniref:Rod shape-determining protein RodA n=1 Tax=Ferroacidibacillus organovorans TaxID=1765683 RepID=A0A162TK47_9BACL|nr:FtsW/RodA/SpoVE family cell cycle protein [Ferroacidibacillus organovorans]KYP80887.1 hypothetical protein AYJ22_01660 [Ferroacidibacillus organovorans]OAG95436.1 hypothetical protein AYW79_00560 [Ferroacidibacillus organovorans]OPG17559.1 hypothetical protein B2M26_00935 [Ferroacidibacillus organovorans]